MKGCSRLYLALDEAAAEFVHSERAEDERVAILFSDGEVACNRDPADKAFASAAGLKNYGRLVTVGMDAQWGRRRRTSAKMGNQEFLQSLATEPYKENYFQLQSFGDSTEALLDTVIEGVCNKGSRPSPETPAPTFAPAPTLDSLDPQLPYVKDPESESKSSLR